MPLFRDRLAQTSSTATEHGDRVVERVRAAASNGERSQIVEGIVRETAARILRLPAARIDARRPLGSLGLDSLMSLELRNRLASQFERTLPATLLWNYPSIAALTAYLLDGGVQPARNEGATAATLDTPAAAASSIAVGDVAAMSDDDAMRALRRGRGGTRSR
jgi:acyl carrier protein